MKEGKGAFGTVFSSPRLPLLQERVRDILYLPQVSKVFHTYRDYYQEVTAFGMLCLQHEFPKDLFCSFLDHGRINKLEVRKYRWIYNTTWCGGETAFENASHQVIYPRGKPVSVIPFYKFMVYFENILRVVEFLDEKDLAFDDFKNQNLLVLDGKMVVSDYSSIVSIADLIMPATFYSTNFKSRYYYIHSPVLNSLLCRLILKEPAKKSRHPQLDECYLGYFHQCVDVIPDDYQYEHEYSIEEYNTYEVYNTSEKDDEIVCLKLSGKEVKKMLLEFFQPFSSSEESITLNTERLESIVSKLDNYLSILHKESSIVSKIRNIIQSLHVYNLGIMLLECIGKHYQSSNPQPTLFSKDKVLHLAIYCCLQYYYNPISPSMSTTMEKPMNPISPMCPISPMVHLLFPNIEKVNLYYKSIF